MKKKWRDKWKDIFKMKAYDTSSSWDDNSGINVPEDYRYKYTTEASSEGWSPIKTVKELEEEIERRKAQVEETVEKAIEADLDEEQCIRLIKKMLEEHEISIEKLPAILVTEAL